MGKVNIKSNVNKQNNKKAKNSKVVKKTRCDYVKGDIKLAVAEVLVGMTVAEVSRKYNIPESTIRAKKMNKYSNNRPGPSTVLSEQEENELAQWIFYCCKQGFPVTKQKLVESVKLICDNDKRKTPFINNKPGRSWLEGFLKRHPNVSERVSENLSLTRAKVTEYGIRGWFKGVGDYFIQASTDEDDLLKIDPTRVFNADEIGVSMNPKPSSVLAPKGTKNVYSVVSNNEKENVTVLVTANAAGTLAPSLALFAGQSVPKDVIKVAPPNFSFGYSDNGWMTAKNFYEYVTNVFFPWIVQSNIKLPVIIYIDGHCSHVTSPLSKFCSENQIILIALFPNATHILQPLDVALFRTFRASYQKSFQNLCESSGTISIKKSQVAHVLKNTFESLNLKKILENGFKTCGLLPFDANAIDYSKVFKKLDNLSTETSSNVEEVSNISKDSEALKLLESLINEEKLASFRVNYSSFWRGRKEDQSLFDIWYKLARPTSVAQEENISDNNESRQSPVDIVDMAMTEDQMSISASNPENTTEEIAICSSNANIGENDFEHYMVGDHGDLVLLSTETSEPSFFATSYVHDSLQENVATTPLTPEVSMNVQISDLTLPPSSPTAVTICNTTNQENFPTRSEIFEEEDQTYQASSEIILIPATGIKETCLLDVIQDSPSLIVESDVNAPESTREQQQDKFQENISNNEICIEANQTDQPLSLEADTISTADLKEPASILDQIQLPAPLRIDSDVDSPDQLQNKLPLGNIVNTDPDIDKFSEPLRKLCHWPKLDLTKKNKKRSNNSFKVPSVLSSTQWQEILETKENEKLSKIEETKLKKKIKIEQQEFKKVEKEKERARKEEERLQKEKLRVEKEREKFLKQQKKMQDIEAKQKLQEETLLKKLKTAEIKKKLAELQREEAELQGNNK